eukprot:GILK01010408.1.p1 GENE.GILK01010408.1~~GILK01010408.1.p1  ORF type:complete len:512 (-),score=11.95 GILK01010408.1:97-1632(-)
MEALLDQEWTEMCQHVADLQLYGTTVQDTFDDSQLVDGHITNPSRFARRVYSVDGSASSVRSLWPRLNRARVVVALPKGEYSPPLCQVDLNSKPFLIVDMLEEGVIGVGDEFPESEWANIASGVTEDIWDTQLPYILIATFQVGVLSGHIELYREFWSKYSKLWAPYVRWLPISLDNRLDDARRAAKRHGVVDVGVWPTTNGAVVRSKLEENCYVVQTSTRTVVHICQDEFPMDLHTLFGIVPFPSGLKLFSSVGMLSQLERTNLFHSVNDVFQRHALGKLQFYVYQGRKYTIRMGTFLYCYVSVAGIISNTEIPAMHCVFDELRSLLDEDMEDIVNIEVWPPRRHVCRGSACSQCGRELPKGLVTYVCVLCEESAAATTTATFCLLCQDSRFNHLHAGKQLYARFAPDGFSHSLVLARPDDLKVSLRSDVSNVVCNRCQSDVGSNSKMYQSPSSESCFWCQTCVETGCLDAGPDFQPHLLELTAPTYLVELWNTRSQRYSRSMSICSTGN